MIAAAISVGEADQQAEQERADGAAAAALALECGLALEVADHRHRIVGKRPLALDQPLRQIFGHRVDHLADVDALGQHLAAIAAVLQEPVDPLVAAHGDVRDRVDPQPRGVAPADAAVEQVDVVRQFREQRVERLVQELEPRHLGVVQVDHDAGALGLFDPRLAQGVLQPPGFPGLRGRLILVCVLPAPHAPSYQSRPAAHSNTRRERRTRRNSGFHCGLWITGLFSSARSGRIIDPRGTIP